MTLSLRHRVAAVIRTLQDTFTFQPQTNYQKLFSHSQAELFQKSWFLTANQLNAAVYRADTDGSKFQRYS